MRIRNKGTHAAGSGAVTVKAFHADPGIGLTWPEDWNPMTTPSVAVPNVLPGAANQIVVGPFPWTPSVVGHECVLAVVECANDHAVTQDLLATDHVADGDMVPFDNNIAQRNLVPTSAKDGGKRNFVLRNPFREQKTMELRVTSTLPKGWTFSPPKEQRITLKPREKRSVEIAIARGTGADATKSKESHRLTITGVIDGRAVGGMTFYLAPPPALSKPATKPKVS